ncbi:hemerythrin domain-containing protein [Gordonia caeni]
MTRGVLAATMAREHYEIDAVFDEFSVPPPGVPATDWVPTLTAGLRALRRHIYIEEEIVFPPLRQGALQMPIMVMLTEHGEMWRRMEDRLFVFQSALTRSVS